MARDFAKLQWSEWARKLPLEISLALVVGTVLAMVGPYDTYRYPLLPRMGFWLGLTAAWFLIVSIAELVGAVTLPGDMRPGPRLAIVYAAAALPMCALVWGASDELTHGQDVVVPHVIYLQTLLIGASASLIVKALLPRLSTQAPTEGSPLVASPSMPVEAQPAPMPEASLSRLEHRLPRHLRNAIFALSSEDHYVRIHTAQGSHMVLMRLSDAIDELDGLSGGRVHRSWWVADAAPSRFQPKGRTAVLALPGDLEVPVSAPYLAFAEAMADRHAAPDHQPLSIG